MKKVLFLAALLFLAQQGLFSQRTCFSTEAVNQKRATDPNYDLQMKKQEQVLRKWVATNTIDPNFANRAVRTIPCVVHVLYNTSAQNISDVAIQNMITQMNQDYSNANPGASGARSAVQGLRTNTQIQFCLAQQDPNGNATTGIEHIFTNESCFDPNTETDKMKSSTTNGVNAWNTNYYLNFWIVSLCGNTTTSGVGGYAYIPATGSGLVGSGIDGVVIDYYWGIGSDNPAWTHEVGHYLGLHHTWGDLSSNACGNVFPDTDDGFSDTPDSKEANFGCPFQTSCTGNSSYGDLVEDFMDYSNCSVLFTPNQSNYMNNTLTNLRSALVTNNNRCSSTGAPIASFTGTPRTICTGQTVTFTSTSSGNPTSYSWQFPGGSPSTSTAASPTVTYSTAGSYNVTLTVTNSNGSNANTQTNYITVSGTTALPLAEGFESATFPPTGWSLTNPDNATTWVRTTSASGFGTSSASAYINDYNYNTVGEKDWLITPSYNFSGVTNGRIKWDYAYATYSATGYGDTLEVMYSTNCGATWTSLWRKGGSALRTVTSTAVTSSFVPTSSQWKRDSVSLAALAGQTNVRFAFVNINDYENNLFLDNVNIYNSTAQGGQAPVADFIGTPTTVVAGNSVSFTDLSTNSPTSWAWTFTGAAQTSSTLQNPVITYNTPGVYPVTLVATNSNGNNSITKQNYITVVAAGGTSCDTLANFYTNDSLASYYTSAGYVTGNNSLLDKGFAEYYDNPTPGASVTGAFFYFAKAKTTHPTTSAITVKVWNADGGNGLPGTVAASQTVLINSIAQDVANQQATFVSFTTPGTVAGAFYIGYEFTYVTGDTVIVYSTTLNSPDPDYGFIESSSNTWSSVEDIYSVGIDIWTFPILCTQSAGNSPTASFTASSTSICAGNTVTFTSTSTGSPTSYSWQLTGGSPSASSAQSPVVTYANPGTYTVALTVSNGNGSNTSTQNNYITVYALPSLTTSSTAVGCYGASTGSAQVAVTGTAPYTYSWSGGGSSASISNKAAGTYTVTVTDGHQCSATASVNISQPLAALTLTPLAGDAACNQPNGSASVTANGGAGNYTYHWSNNGVTAAISNLSPGTYSVTVTDGNGCSATSSVTVGNQTSNFSVTINATNASCGANNGSAVAVPNNVNFGVSYVWSTGATSGSINNLAPGTYSVTVTNNSGCTASASATITNTSPTINIAFTTTPANCGTSNGGASATVSGGTSPYTYLWSTGGNNNSISGVAAGAYTLTVTDNGGCTASNVANVSNTGAPTVNINSTAPACFGGTNGSATVTATGGSQPYTYTWSTGGTTATVSSLAAGTYTVTVHDNSQCIAVQSVVIANPAQVTANVTTTSATCGNQNGSATATATGGNNSFTYTWSTGASQAAIQNLGGGSYTVTITDGNGCTAIASGQVSSAAAPVVNVAGTNGTCQAGPQASANATGGTLPYTYNWSNGGNTQTISNVAAGSYTVTVSDANGCTASGTTSVTDNSGVSVTFNNQQPTQGSNGSATANPTGGNAPYTYQWSTGGTTQTVNNLAAGSYTVTVTDANGCVKVATTTLVTVGIQDVLSAASIQVFPNPANTYCNIQVDLGSVQDLNLEVYNSLGQQVWGKRLMNYLAGTETMDMSNWSGGIYIVKVQLEKSTRTIRLIKQ